VQVHAVPKELQQKGMTVCPGIEAVTRPGFWVSPNNLPRRDDEKAGEGEKVILHLHGGGYVRGHPLWIDAPHGFALTLRQRLFCKSRFIIEC
jgi:acetyl esterase/lipase